LEAPPGENVDASSAQALAHTNPLGLPNKLRFLQPARCPRGCFFGVRRLHNRVVVARRIAHHKTRALESPSPALVYQIREDPPSGSAHFWSSGTVLQFDIGLVTHVLGRATWCVENFGGIE